MPLHVVFGTGPLGLAVMRALGAGEKQVRMVNRSGRTEAPSDVEGVAADAHDRAAAPLPTDLPSRPVSPTGRVRALVATMLMEAHGRGEVPATIGRASDFFGPHVRLSKMGDRAFIPVLRGRAAER